MSLFAKKVEFVEVRQTSGAAITNLSASSVTPCQLRIERQDRRLEKIVLNITGTLATPTTAAARDALEGILKDIRLKVNDAAGSDRLALKANSTTLINRARFLNGDIDRYTRTYYGTKAAGAFEINVPIYFRHPLLTEAVGHKTSLALDARFMGADPILEIDLADFNSIGLTVGTSTFLPGGLTILAAMHYRQVPSDVPYIPTQFFTNEIWGNTAAGEQYWTFPEDGHLAGFMMEEFTSSTARGAALSNTGVRGEWQFQYNGTERQSWTTKLQEADNDCWARNGVTSVVSNPSFTTDIDFLHDTEQGEAMSPGSTYNMYIANAGQRARLYTNNLVASASVKVSTYKFLTTNLQQLIGA